MSVIGGVVLVVLLVAILVWNVVPWRELAVRWVGNDPHKARVFVRTGSGIKAVDGWYRYASGEGQVFKYRWQNRDIAVVVPAEYAVEYYEGRRFVWADEGEAIARPLPGELVTDGMPAEESSLLLLGSSVVKLVQAISAPSMFTLPDWWKWGALGLLAMAVYGLYQTGHLARIAEYFGVSL